MLPLISPLFFLFSTKSSSLTSLSRSPKKLSSLLRRETKPKPSDTAPPKSNLLDLLFPKTIQKAQKLPGLLKTSGIHPNDIEPGSGKKRFRFQDKVKIIAIGGRGGNGCITWNTTRSQPKGPPAGGNGGHGGNIILECSETAQDLSRIDHAIRGNSGKHGSGNDKHGANGPDTIIKVPIGTVIRKDSRKYDLAFSKKMDDIPKVRAISSRVQMKKGIEAPLALEFKESGRIAQHSLKHFPKLQKQHMDGEFSVPSYILQFMDDSTIDKLYFNIHGSFLEGSTPLIEEPEYLGIGMGGIKTSQSLVQLASNQSNPNPLQNQTLNPKHSSTSSIDNHPILASKTVPDHFVDKQGTIMIPEPEDTLEDINKIIQQTDINPLENPQFDFNKPLSGNKSIEFHDPVPKPNLPSTMVDPRKKPLVETFDHLPLLFEFNHIGQQYILAQGGKGGSGNKSLPRSIDENSQQLAVQGGAGETIRAVLEQKFLGDLCLLGLPNSGKSTLLSAITRLRTRTADFPFTTLQPNIGVLPLHSNDMSQMSIIDLPGLVADEQQKSVSIGKATFRHVERARMIGIVLDLSTSDWQQLNVPELEEKTQILEILAQEPEFSSYSKGELNVIYNQMVGTKSKNNSDSLDSLSEDIHSSKSEKSSPSLWEKKTDLSTGKVKKYVNTQRRPWDDLVSLQLMIALHDVSLLKKPTLIIANKLDHPKAQENLEILKTKTQLPIFPISALFNQGLEELVQGLGEFYFEDIAEQQSEERAAMDILKSQIEATNRGKDLVSSLSPEEQSNKSVTVGIEPIEFRPKKHKTKKTTYRLEDRGDGEYQIIET